MRKWLFSYPLLRNISNSLFVLLILNTVVISIFVYGIISRQITEEIYSALTGGATLASSVTEAFFSEVSRLSANLAANETDVTNALFQKQNTVLDYYAMIRLKNVSLSYPYVAYTGIYRQQEDRLTATIDIGKSSADELKSKLQADFETGAPTTFFAIEVKPNAKNASLLPRKTITFASYSSLCRRDEIGAVLLGVETAYFQELYSGIDSAKYGPFVLMDKSGNTLSAGGDSAKLLGYENAGIPQKIQEIPAKDGYFIWEINKRQVVVSFSKNMRIGGIVFQVAAYDDVFVNLSQMRGKIFVGCFLVLCAGTVASYLLAYRLLSPLYGLLHKYSYKPSGNQVKSEIAFLDSAFIRLSDGEAKSKVLMRHMALYDLLINQHISDHTTGEVLKDFSRFPFYTITLLSIDREASEKAVSVQEASVLRYALCNIAAEILSRCCKRLDTVIMNSTDVAVILSLKDGKNPEGLAKALSETAEAMGRFYQAKILCAVSSVVGDIYELSDAYEEAAALRGQNFLLERPMIWAGEVQTKGENRPFPIAVERRLLAALFKNRQAELTQSLEAFFADISATGYECAISYIARLITDISQDCMETLPQAPPVPTHMILAEIHKARTISQVQRRVEMLCKTLAEKYNAAAAYGPTVKRALKLAKENYADEGFSINSVADLLGITTSYFNRVFKKEYGISFGACLNLIRLEHARELLLTTAMPVAEVSVRSGFGNLPYFYTLFKKVYGMTPAEYRSAQ